MAYRDLIKQHAPDCDPAIIEAWMRSEHGTLDHLSPERFATEVQIARICAQEAGPDMNRLVLESMGL